MPEIALYYPYVSPRDESWVKQALLFWPRIQRIVPEDYPVKDTPMLQRLVDEKVLTNVLPDVGASGLANSFIDFVSEHAPTLRGLYSVEQAGMLPARICRHLDLDPGLNWIHTGKLDPAATRALVSSGLAVPNTLEPSWLGVIRRWQMSICVDWRARCRGSQAEPLVLSRMKHFIM